MGLSCDETVLGRTPPPMKLRLDCRVTQHRHSVEPNLVVTAALGRSWCLPSSATSVPTRQYGFRPPLMVSGVACRLTHVAATSTVGPTLGSLSASNRRGDWKAGVLGQLDEGCLGIR